MTHFTTPKFWESFGKLPNRTQLLARKNFELLKEDPYHPSLHFKQIGSLWSVRVGLQYRALGKDVDKGVLWFWVGSHAEYNKLIR